MQVATRTEIAEHLRRELRCEPFYPLIKVVDVMPAPIDCGWGAWIEGRLTPDHRRAVNLAKRRLQQQLVLV